MIRIGPRTAVALAPWLGGLARAAQEAAADVADVAPTAADALGSGWAQDLLILFGCFFLLAAAIGLVRFPDFYTRIHASTKLVTLGGVGIFGGAALAFAPAQATERVLLIAVFFFLTAPLSGYMVARSGYLRGLAPYQEDTSVDEWEALGSTSSDLPQGDDATPPRWGGLGEGGFEEGGRG